jgi:hypothetical protein
MAEPVEFPVPKGGRLVPVLTELLQRAKTGEIESMAAVIVSGSHYETIVTATEDAHAVIGALFILAQSIAADLSDR